MKSSLLSSIRLVLTGIVAFVMLTSIVPTTAYAQDADTTITIARSRHEANVWMIANRDLLLGEALARIGAGQMRVMLSSTQHPVKYALVSRADASRLVTVLDILCANRHSRAIHLTCQSGTPGDRWHVHLTDRMCARSKEPLERHLPPSCARPYLTSRAGKTIVIPHPVLDEEEVQAAPSVPSNPGQQTPVDTAQEHNAPPIPRSPQINGIGPGNPTNARLVAIEYVTKPATEKTVGEQTPEDEPLRRENRRLRTALYATISLFLIVLLVMFTMMGIGWQRGKKEKSRSSPQTQEEGPLEDSKREPSDPSVIISFKEPSDEGDEDQASHKACLTASQAHSKLVCAHREVSDQLSESEKRANKLLDYIAHLEAQIAAFRGDQNILLSQMEHSGAERARLEEELRRLRNEINGAHADARLKNSTPRAPISGVFDRDTSLPSKDYPEAAPAPDPLLDRIHTPLTDGTGHEHVFGEPFLKASEEIAEGSTQAYNPYAPETPTTDDAWAREGPRGDLREALRTTRNPEKVSEREPTSPGFGPNRLESAPPSDGLPSTIPSSTQTDGT